MIHLRRLRAGHVVATVSLAMVIGAGTGLAGIAPAQAQETGSSVTVAWNGEGNDPAIAALQPDHAALTSDGEGNDAGSGHWNDFKDLTVTVDQTTGLIDQSITITASGMDPSTRFSNLGSGFVNYLQVFQCWGDPEDPTFNQTCQWGGYSTTEVGGSAQAGVAELLGPGTSNWNADRGGSVAGIDLAGGIDDPASAAFRFTAVTGDVNHEASVVSSGDMGSILKNRGLGRFFTSSNSNELPYVPFGGDGNTAPTSFVVQSAAAQPYLGCGDPNGAGETCYVVIVPRGTHSGTIEGHDTICSQFQSPDDAATYAYGLETLSGQVGSPIDAVNCSFWDDRIVIPLDFENPYLDCPTAAATRGVVGTELLAQAMSSWQGSLCQGDGGATFVLTTNSGDLARAQLLSGQTGLAAVSRPVTAASIGTANAELLDAADVHYAPLVNTAFTVGFVSDVKDGITVSDIKLTPRLLAKLLTQSYINDVPFMDGQSSVGDSQAFLSDAAVFKDEEWVALGNPTGFHSSVGRNGNWVVTGPQGDDAIRLMWDYILADADARAFLAGDPDPWGNTINRYYLPSGNDLAAGGGYDLLTEAIDTFPKADQTLTPSTSYPYYRGIQLDSTAFLPYTGSFHANAVTITRVFSGQTRIWDPNKFSADAVGFFVPGEPQLPGGMWGRLLMGPTTASDAELMGLSTAQLALPLSEATTAATVRSAREFVPYNAQAVATAIASQVSDDSEIATLDLTALPSGAYPLSTTIYAAVNLNATTLDASARSDYAHLLEYAVGAGNEVTGSRGGLPEGYVPLTQAQQEAATELAATIMAGPKPTPPPTATVTVPSRTVTNTSTSAASDTSSTDQEDTPGTETETWASDIVTEQVTAAAESSPAQAALGGGLLAGVAGLAASPFLLRRRELTS